MNNNVRVSKIQATSRMSFKISDNFYTVEYLEERTIANPLTDEELDNEKARLFNSVNATVDGQAKQIVDSLLDNSKRR